MTPIPLTDERQFDIQLALATGCFDGIEDADLAAYVVYCTLSGDIPDNKILGRICDNTDCAYLGHLALIGKTTQKSDSRKAAASLSEPCLLWSAEFRHALD